MECCNCHTKSSYPVRLTCTHILCLRCADALKLLEHSQHAVHMRKDEDGREDLGDTGDDFAHDPMRRQRFQLHCPVCFSVTRTFDLHSLLTGESVVEAPFQQEKRNSLQAKTSTAKSKNSLPQSNQVILNAHLQSRNHQPNQKRLGEYAREILDKGYSELKPPPSSSARQQRATRSMSSAALNQQQQRSPGQRVQQEDQKRQVLPQPQHNQQHVPESLQLQLSPICEGPRVKKAPTHSYHPTDQIVAIKQGEQKKQAAFKKGQAHPQQQVFNNKNILQKPAVNVSSAIPPEVQNIQSDQPARVYLKIGSRNELLDDSKGRSGSKQQKRSDAKNQHSHSVFIDQHNRNDSPSELQTFKLEQPSSNSAANKQQRILEAIEEVVQQKSQKKTPARSKSREPFDNTASKSRERQQKPQQSALRIDWDMLELVTRLAEGCQEGQPLKCPKHDDFISLYCERERTLLCVQCLFSSEQEHAKHNVGPIKNNLSVIKSDNEFFKSMLSEKNSRVEGALLRAQGNRDFISETQQKLQNDVAKQFAQLRALLQQREREIVSELQHHFEGAMTAFDGLVSEYGRVQQHIKHALKTSNSHNELGIVYSHFVFRSMNIWTKNVEEEVPILTADQLQTPHLLRELQHLVDALQCPSEPKSLTKRTDSLAALLARKQPEVSEYSSPLKNSYVAQTLTPPSASLQNRSHHQQGSKQHSHDNSFERFYQVYMSAAVTSAKGKRNLPYSASSHSSSSASLNKYTSHKKSSRNATPSSYTEKAERMKRNKSKDKDKWNSPPRAPAQDAFSSYHLITPDKSAYF